jgi:menaquinone-dependent protoporphyrinogen oxidase
MAARVLVAYSTRSGSTGEVAEAIGASIREIGFVTDVMPVQQVVSLAGRAVILGAPLYFGRLPKEFHQFVCLHRETLEKLLPWCFVLGPTRNEPADFEAARKQATKQFSRYQWFVPADVHVFGGRWDVTSFPFPFSIVRHIPGNPVAKIPASDVRDWAEIQEWAIGIARKIKSAA